MHSMPEHAIQCVAALKDARHPAASSMNINAAPVLVIERIAAVADSPSLVLLASCNRHLWQCIHGLQHYWKQRYMQEHPLEDDDELSWLRWYIKTLRASANDTSDDGDIDWFRAYCHRNACDANWFKNDPKRVKDVHEVTVRSRNCDIVLDRAYSRASSDHCHVLEYCQPKGGSQGDRYWRRYKLRCSNSGNETRLSQCMLSSTHVVAVGGVSLRYDTICIWPTHRLFSTKPRRISYPTVFFLSIRGSWLLFTTRETHRSDANEWAMTTIYVVDLATGRSSKWHTHLYVQDALLQRVTDDTATVVLISYDIDGGHRTVYWSLWLCSPSQPDGDCRCLMQGKVRILNTTHIPDINRLDDNRFTVMIKYDGGSLPEARDAVDLAVISTRQSDEDSFIDSQQPVWTRHFNLEHANIMVPQDRIIIYSANGWTVCRLSDGSILSFVGMDNVRPLLDEYCGQRVIDYLRDWDYYKNDYMICPSEDFKSLIAVDVAQPGRIKKLDIAYLMELHVAAGGELLISEYDLIRLMYSRGHLGKYGVDPSNLSVYSHHTLYMEFASKHKMLDLSVQL